MPVGELQPRLAPHPGLVGRGEPLGHDPLELLGLGGPEERVAVVERLRELHVLIPAIEELQQALAPEVKGVFSGSFPFAGADCAALTERVLKALKLT